MPLRHSIDSGCHSHGFSTVTPWRNWLLILGIRNPGSHFFPPMCEMKTRQKERKPRVPNENCPWNADSTLASCPAYLAHARGLPTTLPLFDQIYYWLRLVIFLNRRAIERSFVRIIISNDLSRLTLHRWNEPKRGNSIWSLCPGILKTFVIGCH